MKCIRCNSDISKESWNLYLKRHPNEEHKHLCGKCRKSIATTNRNIQTKNIKFVGYKFIAPNGKIYQKSDTTLLDFEKDIKQNFYKNCKCNNCNNYISFGNWNKALPNNTKISIIDNIKILDMSNWRCKSCSSRTNIQKANIPKDRTEQNLKISKTVKKQYKKFEYNYKMTFGLINKLNKKLKIKYRKLLKNCKSVKEIKRINKRVHSILSKNSWKDELIRKKHLDSIDLDKMSKITTALWKNSVYRNKQKESHKSNKSVFFFYNKFM